MKRFLYILLTVMMLVLMSGCVMVKSDVILKEDLTGTWKAKIYVPDGLKKEDMEKEIKGIGISNYTLKELKEQIQNPKNGQMIDVGCWEVVTEFKNKEDLDKIVEGLRVLAGNGKQKNPNVLKKDEDGKVVVDLSNLKMEQTTFHIEGIIDPASTKGKLINESTIEFNSNQPIIFQFKPGIGNKMVGGVIGGGILLAVVGYIRYRRKKVK